MHRPTHRGAWQFIPLALSLILAGCDGFVAVRGVVRNPRGEPVAGAKIHVTDITTQHWYTESDANGCFNASGATAGRGPSSEPLTVVAPGYKKASAKVRTAGTQNHVIVTLVPSDSQGASRIQILTPENDKDLQPCNSSDSLRSNKQN